MATYIIDCIEAGVRRTLAFSTRKATVEYLKDMQQLPFYLYDMSILHIYYDGKFVKDGPMSITEAIDFLEKKD